MSEQLNLYQKMVKVRESIGNINKDSTAGKGSKFSYNYVSESQILAKIQEEMNKQNLLLFPKINTKKYVKEGNQYIVELDITYTWINADKPEETLEIPYYAVGQQSDASKALGTSLTYANRYFLLKMFNLPTDEDDADAKSTQQPKQQYNKQQYNQPKQSKMHEDNKQLPMQDKRKLELTKQKATDLADIINSQDGADPKNPTTQQQILGAYLKKLNATDITKVSNENLVYMLKAIEGKINNYKAK